MKLGLVVNPTAKYHRAHPGARRAMAEMCARSGVDALYAESRNAQDLARIASEFRGEGVDILAISGGDGTGSMTLTEFARVYGDQPLPTVALLRGGTMNTVCNSLGIVRGRSPELLRRVLGHCKRGTFKTVTADTMIVAGRHYCFLFGVGTVHAFLAAYYEEGTPYPTPQTAVRVLGRGVVSALSGGDYAKHITARVRVALEIDGEQWPTRDYFTVAAGTIDQIGLGFRPFHAKHVGSQGFFHTVCWTMSIPEFAANLPNIWMKRQLGDRFGWDRRARSMTLTAPDEGRLGYMLDGDLRTHDGPLTVGLGPILQLMLP